MLSGMSSELRITHQHSYLYRNQIKIEIHTTFKSPGQINRILEHNKGAILKFWDSWLKKRERETKRFEFFLITNRGLVLWWNGKILALTLRNRNNWAPETWVVNMVSFWLIYLITPQIFKSLLKTMHQRWICDYINKIKYVRCRTNIKEEDLQSETYDTESFWGPQKL